MFKVPFRFLSASLVALALVITPVASDKSWPGRVCASSEFSEYWFR